LVFYFLWTVVNAGCPSVPGFDLSRLEGEVSLEWRYQNTVNLAFCSTQKAPCGRPPGKCAGKENCCGACQTWMSDDGPDGASLGVFEKVLANPDQTVSLYYSGGDSYAGDTRVTYVNLTCNISATKPFIRTFIQAPENPHTPGTPYVYWVVVATNLVCPNTCYPYSECSQCASQSGCQWCLESEGCFPQKFPCQNWIRNPAYCPTCTGNTCKACLSNPMGKCAWCQAVGCISQSADCQTGRIVDPKYCSEN